MTVNAKPSERVGVESVVGPASLTGTTNGDWINLGRYHVAQALILVGAAGGSIDAKITQAKNGSGLDAKDVAGKAIVQITGANQQAQINVRNDELDTDNGFSWVRIEVTAGAARLAAAVLLPMDARHAPASENNPSSVQAPVG